MGGENSGRYDTFKQEYCELARNYCLLGAIDRDLAQFFGVCLATIYNWKDNHPEFVEAINEGKVVADARVAKALYHRACGYSHADEHICTVSDGSGCGSHVERVPTVKHYPPDSASMIFWLKNRQPDKWRDKQEIDAKIEQSSVNYDKLSKEDKMQIAEILERAENGNDE